MSHHAKQGLVQSFSVYIDTLFVCTATGLMLIIIGCYSVQGADGGYLFTGMGEVGADATWVQAAVSTLMPTFGSKFVAIALFFFAFTTILNQCYSTACSVSYFFVDKGHEPQWVNQGLQRCVLPGRCVWLRHRCQPRLGPGRYRSGPDCVDQLPVPAAQLPRGHIRIGTFSSISCHVLAPVLKEFKALYPNISIGIHEGDDAGVTAMLTRDEVDIGFLDAPVPAGFDSFLVRRDPFLAVVSESSPLAAMDTIPLSVYASEPTILYDEGSQKEAMGIFRKNKITPRVEYTSQDGNLILSLIETGLCIGCMGQLILSRNFYRVVSRPTEPQYYREIMFVVRSIEHASPAAAHFITFFKDWLSRNPQPQA